MSAMEKITKTIVTHNGSFHSDDIFAVATLMIFLEKEHGKDAIDIQVVRTRDPAKIVTGDYVVDVGEIYDPAAKRFDHHQRGKAGVRDNTVPYAAFGLVWKEYGLVLCEGNKDLASAIEEKVIMPIDARDNGITLVQDVKIYPLQIQEIVALFKTTWKEDAKELDTRFMYLVTIARNIIERAITQGKDEVEGKERVLQIYRETADKRILILDKGYYFDNLMHLMPEVFLVVSPDGTSGSWMVECARELEQTYQNRMFFPAAWGGKRGVDLEKEIGVTGTIFCHANLFLIVAKTKEAALELANKALKIALNEAGV